MDKLRFQQLLTLLCLFGCGLGLAVRPDMAERWFGGMGMLLAYWLPSPSRENHIP